MEIANPKISVKDDIVIIKIGRRKYRGDMKYYLEIERIFTEFVEEKIDLALFDASLSEYYVTRIK